ncbi:carbohydrate-binding domain-containing protein [Roseomonas sp. E05]|uniref:carbohydrate-binding domain-containing protein n=1 Tax=Roseomonas sp. E05 TaxID=3046310 RepID=UPI0024BA25FE|nr:carbohydrate-binding domain-containing protein [Roseomonas sp. E05]MDJ0390011.1 carbohydrate-binding domain-containing protein [Roseomonas sp. E05]
MVALSAGSGTDKLILQISQNAWRGSAQYIVKVDGKQVGGTFTASADHNAGLSDTLTLHGDWAAGAHQVSVSFLNDAYGGSASTDRNLFIDGASYNGADLKVDIGVPSSARPGQFSFTEGASASLAPVALSAGSGSDTLVLKVSQQAWQGSAQYIVKVDGKQVGGTFTASADHNAGLSDTLTLHGDWAAGAHQVSVSFLNDAYGGSVSTDRNLFIDGASYNGADLKVDIGVPSSARPGQFSFTEGATVPQSASDFASTPTWSDEFNDTRIDTSKWTNLFDGRSWDNDGFFWDRNQLSESGGQLNIGLDRQADGWHVGGLAAYTTPDGAGFGFQYGKVEIRAKASQEVTGAGMCFLLWPSDDDHWPPEIDILETPKGDGLFTNHWQGPGGNGDNVQETHQFALNYAEWHTYGLEWTPDSITLLVDGKAQHTMTTHIASEPMSVALMGYVGSPSQSWYGTPDSAVSHVDIAVDYVRVYDSIA